MTAVTWDIVNKGMDVVLSNGNLTSEVNGGIDYSTRYIKSNTPKTNGKHYMELTFDTVVTSGTWRIIFGVAESTATARTNGILNEKHTMIYGHSGTILKDGATNFGETGIIVSTGDTVGLSIDMEGKKVGFFKNGILQGGLIDYTGVDAVVFVEANTNGMKWTVNFGATPFKYSIPEGYKPYQLVNKTLILSSDGYKKYDEGSPAVDGKNIIPIMTSDKAPSGVASASSFDTTSVAWKAFSDTGYWSAQMNSKSAWLMYEFLSETVVEKYSIEPNTPTYAPNSWVLEGSNDGEIWKVLDSQTIEIWEVNEVKEFYLHDVVQYSKYRIKSDAISKGFFQIKRWKLFDVNISKTPPSWKTVSQSLPTLPQFQDEGMEDLSIFDRKVQPVLESPQQMTSSVLGEGKVFKGTVDLKKHFDLRNLEVK